MKIISKLEQIAQYLTQYAYGYYIIILILAVIAMCAFTVFNFSKKRYFQSKANPRLGAQYGAGVGASITFLSTEYTPKDWRGIE